MNDCFELNNEQRKYVGLIPVEKHWERVKLNDMYLYFDGDTIRKQILVNDNLYKERELCEKTAENRTVLLPKTSRGKVKKLNFTATQSFAPLGVYFSFSSEGVTIANYSTQIAYFRESFKIAKNINDLKIWLDQWVDDTTDKDLQETEDFKTSERKHCKFNEGDFFAFKIGRHNWGFGRILTDVAKLRKTEDFNKQKNYGLRYIMTKPLIVKVYHKISDTSDIDISELEDCMALPSQAIMDNRFYYGEYKITGNKPLSVDDYDMLISYGRSISQDDRNTVFLQYGLIYKEADISQFNKYLYENTAENPYANCGVGMGLSIDYLRQCTESQSNAPFWDSGFYDYDLRNPKNIEIKREIFSFFALDADKSYQENLDGDYWRKK